MLIYTPFLKKFGLAGITIWPFIFVSYKRTILENHERIHLQQQKELLVILFYIIYFSEILIRRFRVKSWDEAYKTCSFERECRENQTDPDYLKYRKIWAWADYIK